VTTEVGCPYCIVAGFEFKRMAKNTTDEYVCPHCGHVEHSRFGCNCARCQQQRAFEHGNRELQTHR
jgi:ribosomal protein L37AE/L43A